MELTHTDGRGSLMNPCLEQRQATDGPRIREDRTALTGNLVPRQRVVLIRRLEHAHGQYEQVPPALIRLQLSNLEPQGNAAIRRERQLADDDGRGSILPPGEARDVHAKVIRLSSRRENDDESSGMAKEKERSVLAEHRTVPTPKIVGMTREKITGEARETSPTQRKRLLKDDYEEGSDRGTPCGSKVKRPTSVGRPVAAVREKERDAAAKMKEWLVKRKKNAAEKRCEANDAMDGEKRRDAKTQGEEGAATGRTRGHFIVQEGTGNCVTRRGSHLT
ncbi:hypothetical protein DCS_05090 [Drechmeria coniospora]|uniref:Uncharacterized protein n=1 Tax=Drechmeria coniospora TaxID=98403 RepID=A0A151GLU9_DRECN|nr:hypothetical protein DCS_05090 [Drechmeria coniospora]KYK58077.1 hypothetical protein DCS_05090 [Drechmeria coniospora]